MTQCTPSRPHALASRSTRGPGTSTELACMRSHSSSKPPKRAAEPAHALLGYSDTNVSGSTASLAPSRAASSSRPIALSTQADASRITGVAWIAATRTVAMGPTLTGFRLHPALVLDALRAVGAGQHAVDARRALEGVRGAR